MVDGRRAGRRRARERAGPLRLRRRARGLRRPAGRDPGREPRRAGRGRPGVLRRPASPARPPTRPTSTPASSRPASATSSSGWRWSPTPTSSPTPPTTPGVVTLMTLHTAKGLEFPVVFLTGLEDGVFPHARALGDQPELEEERRLAYVGVTRARERLYISRAVVRSAWGAPSHNPGSRFLDELPVDLVDWRRTEAAQTQWCRPDLSGGYHAARHPHRRRPPQLLLGRAARRRRRPRQAGARDPEPRARRPGAARLVRHGHGGLARGRGRQDGRLDRLRVRGRQAAAAALRARGEAVSPTLVARLTRYGWSAVHDERGVRVDRVAAAGADLEVEVRAGDVAGGADVADQLAAGDARRRR